MFRIDAGKDVLLMGEFAKSVMLCVTKEGAASACAGDIASWLSSYLEADHEAGSLRATLLLPPFSGKPATGVCRLLIPKA